jgi:hypothetical protein
MKKDGPRSEAVPSSFYRSGQTLMTAMILWLRSTMMI